MVKRPKKFVIVDDSSPAVAQAKSREQRVPSLRSWRDFVRECFCFGSEAVNASVRSRERIGEDTKWRFVRQTGKSMYFSRRKRAAACFLTAIGPVITKKAVRKTIIHVVKQEKLSSTIMKNLNKLKLNDS